MGSYQSLATAKTFHLTNSRFYFLFQLAIMKFFSRRRNYFTPQDTFWEVWSLFKNDDMGSVCHCCQGEEIQVEAVPKSALVTPLPCEKLRSPRCDVPFCHEELKHLHKPNNTVDVLQHFQKHFLKCFAVASCEKPLLWCCCSLFNLPQTCCRAKILTHTW